MIRRLLCPGLLETGWLSDSLLAVRDGVVNFYVLRAPAGLVCVDTGWRPAVVCRSFARLGLRLGDVVAVLLTHVHWDHARCASLFFRAELYAGERGPLPFWARDWVATLPVRWVKGDLTLSVGGRTVRLVDTPGHTLGSVAYVVDDHLLFSGDAIRLRDGKALPNVSLFRNNRDVVEHSLRKMAGLAGIDCLLTAHHGLCRDAPDAFANWTRSNIVSADGGCEP